ncbi:uncharacterized protein MONOS_5924 [Monocercomonoides exilis]|uniref:uncharacterized protein n=1 Tax=Monocercomonoides exilis TaxID=2049356 RepID=UPI00355A6FFC|nr:hypothetical protein MONOS_5924 [Monocercomonoides exilis]|eukprot:MONOS_5924.1-p1 / transcript=MONOS_5924.1 / gene=MONOS_5924 / organism=Monocercomonoides_exilis_PA203 / gene_product=unspecified product / transcript_product=unspecified product / location=Mono_scaffold00179:3772-4017(+) / protein_length=82 / sequence_SO=supercontig / SO=protein_coding / is_pseudo=false
MQNEWRSLLGNVENKREKQHRTKEEPNIRRSREEAEDEEGGSSEGISERKERENGEAFLVVSHIGDGTSGDKAGVADGFSE